MEPELTISDNNNFVLEWSLFYAALRSYRSEIYIDKEIHEYASKEILEKNWIQISHCKLNGMTPTEEIQQFHKIVLNKQKFRLSLTSSDEMDHILNSFLVNREAVANFDLTKKMMFKVNYETNGNHDTADRFTEKYGSFLALHGSPVNRFYSILQNGLNLPKSNDDSGLYGFGIYLTSKFDVAFHFAQAHLFDCGWLKEESIKIVAICQVVKHPTAVVRKEHKSSDGFSLDSGIPPEYYLVKDDCMVHVTHILVETSCPISFLQHRSRFQTVTGPITHCTLIDTLTAAFRRNWLLYTIAIYIGVLVIVACFKGRSVIFSDWDTSDLLTIND